MNSELYRMQRQLERLRADCEDFLKASQKETELLNQTRVIPAVTPPTSPNSVDPTPTTEQKQWRFVNEEGWIDERIIRKAVCDPNLLEEIGLEIQARAADARQD